MIDPLRRIVRLRLGSALAAFLLAMFAVPFPAHAGEPLPFDARSMRAMRGGFAARPFVLVFWSASCEPCREELAHWAAFQGRHPEVPLVLVATDPPQDRAAVNTLLARHDFGRARVLVFADEFAERLRYTVDRAWRGEVPRSYFFDASHRAEIRTGPVDPRWAEDWLARTRAVPVQ
jgi:thiol-disulfide isomerase/thioredoxin